MATGRRGLWEAVGGGFHGNGGGGLWGAMTEFPWQLRGRGFSMGIYGSYGGFHSNGGGSMGSYDGVSMATEGAGLLKGSLWVLWGFPWQPGGGASPWEPIGAVGVSMATGGRRMRGSLWEGFHSNGGAGLLHGNLWELWWFPWQPGGRGFSMGAYGCYGGFHGNPGGGASPWEPMGSDPQLVGPNGHPVGQRSTCGADAQLMASTYDPNPQLMGLMLTLRAPYPTYRSQ